MSASPRRRSNSGRWLGWFETGLLSAAILSPIELAELRGPSAGGDGTRLELACAWTSISLFAALGLLLAVVIEGIEVVAPRLPTRARAPLRASGTLIVSWPVASTLFDGSLAATLPGAASAWWWLPALVWVVATAAIHAASRWLAAERAGRPRLMSFGLAGLAFACEYANRRVRTSELFDLHTALIVVSFVGVYLALRLHRQGLAVTEGAAGRIVRGIVLVGLAVNLSFVLDHGLADTSSRQWLTRHGMHTRLLVRVGRGLADGDGDGFARVLGGADCDDADPRRNPAAPEVLGNQVDEDCDGYAAPAASDLPATELRLHDYRAEFATWRAQEAVDDFVTSSAAANILMISVDALRYDVLADDVDNRRDFPGIFALLDESRRFDRAYAPAAGTDLSLSTLLTGRIDGFQPIEHTLPEALAAAGYRTHGVLPSEVLRYAGGTLLTRGLDSMQRLVNDLYERDVGSYSTSRRTTELGLAHLDRMLAEVPQPPRFFLWLHYFDVHEHDEISASDRRLRDVTGAGAGASDDARARYRATVALVDAALTQLRQGLEERGLWDRTVVVFLSDHGESLAEDPRLPDNHGRVVYEPLVHVPLAIRVPGGRTGASLRPVGVVDLMPTILALAGLSPAPADLDGHSLLDELVPATASVAPAPEPPPRALALNESEQRGVIVWPYKLLRRPNDNLVELYDLERDPEETRDLSAAEPRVKERLLIELGGLPQLEIDRSARGRRQRERRGRAAPPPS